MGIMLKLIALFTGHKLVRLVGSPRNGGYVFINSPDLPGFSLMLRPGDADDIGSLTAAIHSPLKTFIEAEYSAYRKLNQNKQLRVMGFRLATPSNLVAELCSV